MTNCIQIQTISTKRVIYKRYPNNIKLLLILEFDINNEKTKNFANIY